MSEYEGLWGSEVLSDVEVVLFEEAHELGVKRKQKVSIGCHKLVLACNSDYFKAQVVNWSSAVHDSQTSTQTDSSRKPRFSMAVPVGQLELGQLLLKSMYQVKPDFADLQQEMWLPLLMLADKYAVSKVITALCINFKDAYTTLDWQVVLGFYMLPEVLSNSSQCRTIRDAVTNKLHLELGDLELVWASAQKQQMLQQLPFGGLRKLLQSEVTKVTSENTAAYTVLQWARAQPTSDDGIKQQMQQLCSLLRMRHCSQLFIATVLSTDANISSCLSPYELQVAALCSSQQALNLNNDVVRKNPTWRRHARPRSACTSITLDWEVKLSTIEQLYKQCVASKCRTQKLVGPSKVWLGRSLALGIQLNPAAKSLTQLPDAPGASSSLGFNQVGLDVHLVLQGGVREMARVTYNVKLLATQGTGFAAAHCRFPAGKGNVISNMSGHAAFAHRMTHMQSSSWADAEAGLRDAHLVHSDCVHICASVLNIE